MEKHEKEDIVLLLLEEQRQLNNFEATNDFENELEVSLVDIILKLIDFPEDNTVAMEEEFGSDWHKQTGIVCVDYAVEHILEMAKPSDVEKTYKLLLIEKEQILRSLLKGQPVDKNITA